MHYKKVSNAGSPLVNPSRVTDGIQANQGFTLIELLVVIAIIGLLSSVVFASIISSREKARIAGARQFESQAAMISGDELAGSWEFNDKSGSIVRDSSGNGNNGAISGTVSWSSESPTNSSDGSLYLNGGSYITVPYSSRLQPANAISLGAWIKMSDLTSTNQKVFSTKEGGGYAFGFDNNYCTEGYFCGMVRVGGGYQFAEFPPSNIKVGKWHHVFMTYNSETIVLYLDGKKAAINENPSGPITYSVSNPLCIGSEADVAACTGGELVSGNVSSARIYTKSLTADNIRSIYSSEAPKFYIASK